MGYIFWPLPAQALTREIQGDTWEPAASISDDGIPEPDGHWEAAHCFKVDLKKIVTHLSLCTIDKLVWSYKYKIDFFFTQ